MLVTHLASTILVEFDHYVRIVTFLPFFLSTKNGAKRLVYVANNENLDCKGLSLEREVGTDDKAGWSLAALAPNIL